MVPVVAVKEVTPRASITKAATPRDAKEALDALTLEPTSNAP